MTLADRQADLVAALVAGAPVPAGFDPERLGAAQRALLRKRAGEVARVWPMLAASAGDRWPEEFAQWAAGRPPHGALRDGWDLARAWASAGRLGSTGGSASASRLVSAGLTGPVGQVDPAERASPAGRARYPGPDAEGLRDAAREAAAETVTAREAAAGELAAREAAEAARKAAADELAVREAAEAARKAAADELAAREAAEAARKAAADELAAREAAWRYDGVSAPQRRPAWRCLGLHGPAWRCLGLHGPAWRRRLIRRL